MSNDLPPVIVVDDEGQGDNGILDRFQMAIEAWPGRDLYFYDNLRDAAEIVRLEWRFVLVLDHNMGAGYDPELARTLGVAAEQPLFGYHLCSALRRQHTFGLAIPVAYLTGALPGDSDPSQSGPSFLQLLQDEGPFLPNFWVDKNRGWLPGEIIKALDDYSLQLVSNLRSASNAVFFSQVPELDDDESV